jgi:hypothetical protein
VKNIFELKSARRVLVAGNVMEHNWADGQVGHAIVFTPRNQDGGAPWTTIADVTFVRNVVARTASGFNILGEDDNYPSQQQQRVVIRDNLVSIDSVTFAGAGRAFQVIAPGRPVVGLLIAHNTVRIAGHSALTMGDSGQVAQGFVYRDNVTERGTYGVFGSGSSEGNPSLQHYVPDHVFGRNVLIGFDMARYPQDNFFPASTAEVGFVDAAAGNFRLAATSPYAAMSTDGTDPGADFDLLEAATAGVSP